MNCSYHRFINVLDDDTFISSFPGSVSVPISGVISKGEPESTQFRTSLSVSQVGGHGSIALIQLTLCNMYPFNPFNAESTFLS